MESQRTSASGSLSGGGHVVQTFRSKTPEQILELIKKFGKEEFTVKEDHLKLLPHLNIHFDVWAYDGAPATDMKRPYGNSDLWGDIYEILTGASTHWDEETDEDLITEEMYVEYKKLHEEMGTVLLICAQNNGVELGRYIAPRYFREWIKDE
jgi:hypothetical protein